jgi:hypothetical protein
MNVLSVKKKMKIYKKINKKKKKKSITLRPGTGTSRLTHVFINKES